MAYASPAPRVLADVLPRTWAREVVLIVGATAFISLFAQIAIPLPFTPVPLTGQTFAVLLAAAALGPWRAVSSMGLYLVAALVGLPVLAPGKDGLHTTGSAIFSLPSFGYVIGFFIAGLLVGALAERGYTRSPLRSAGLMVVGNLAIYVPGALWLAVWLGNHGFPNSFSNVMSAGVTPFLVGDLVKIVLAAGLLPLTWAALKKANLLSK